MGTRLPVARTKKSDENTNSAKEDAEEKRETPLALPRADHCSNYAVENISDKN
jgi:hypothetical protein